MSTSRINNFKYILCDNEDIRRHLKCFYTWTNLLLHTFGVCSCKAKLLLSMTYYGRLYTSRIWCKHISVLSNKSGSQEYAQVFLWLWQIFKCKSNTCRKRVDQFGARMERLIVGFRERLNTSRTCLVICLMNFKAWLCSELCQNVKCLYVQLCINQYPGQCLHACAKPLQCAIVQCVCFWRHRMDFVL